MKLKNKPNCLKFPQMIFSVWRYLQQIKNVKNVLTAFQYNLVNVLMITAICLTVKSVPSVDQDTQQIKKYAEKLQRKAKFANKVREEFVYLVTLVKNYMINHVGKSKLLQVVQTLIGWGMLNAMSAKMDIMFLMEFVASFLSGANQMLLIHLQNFVLIVKKDFYQRKENVFK